MEFLIATLHRYGSSGGLKGNKAPGDAHPYLALFYLGFLGDSGFCAQNLKNFVVMASFSGLRGGIGGFRVCFGKTRDFLRNVQKMLVKNWEM